jgi:hypothetical protein
VIPASVADDALDLALTDHHAPANSDAAQVAAVDKASDRPGRNSNPPRYLAKVVQFVDHLPSLVLHDELELAMPCSLLQ